MWEKSRRCFWNKKINQSPDAVVLAHARVCATSERKQGQRKKVFSKGNNSLPRFSYMSNTVTVAAAAALTPRMTSRVGVWHVKSNHLCVLPRCHTSPWRSSRQQEWPNTDIMTISRDTINVRFLLAICVCTCMLPFWDPLLYLPLSPYPVLASLSMHGASQPQLFSRCLYTLLESVICLLHFD